MVVAVGTPRLATFAPEAGPSVGSGLRVAGLALLDGKLLRTLAPWHLGDGSVGRAAGVEEVAVPVPGVLLGARVLLRAGLLYVPGLLDLSGFLDLVLPVVLGPGAGHRLPGQPERERADDHHNSSSSSSRTGLPTTKLPHRITPSPSRQRAPGLQEPRAAKPLPLHQRLASRIIPGEERRRRRAGRLKC